jgi:YVTN family beta-propeller protein
MSRHSETGNCVSRIGLLAVALGLGAAVASGHGVAAAEPSDSESVEAGPASTGGPSTDGAPTDRTTAPNTAVESDDASTRDGPATKVTASTVRIVKGVDEEEDSDDAESVDAAVAGKDHDISLVAPSRTADPTSPTPAAVPDNGSDHPVGISATRTADVADVEPIETPSVTAHLSRRVQPLMPTGQPVAGDVQALSYSTQPSAPVPSTFATASVMTSVPALIGQPVTLQSIVTDVLTWLGFSGLAANVPVPPLPVPRLIEGLWLAVRRFEYTWNNQRPSAQPTVVGQQPFSGVITGQLNATDYDDDHLTFTVTDNPAHGTVTVDQAGNFVYTPSAAFAQTGGDDAFTVTMDDTIGNPPHVHGLLDVVKLVPPSQSIVHITVSPVEKVTGTIRLDGPPFDMAITPDGARAYVSIPSLNKVSVIATATETVTTSISLPNPQWVAISPDGTRVYVTTDGPGFLDNVSVIDTTTNTVIATVAAGRGAEDVAVSPDGSYVYVTNFLDDTISVIDTATDTNIGAIPVGDAPGRVAFSPDGAYAYLADIDDHVIRVINNTTHTIETSIDVGSTPQWVAVSPDGTRLYTANNIDKTVSVVDVATGTLIATVPIGGYPNSVAVSPDGTLAYVANFFDDNVKVIDATTNAVIASVPVIDGPWVVVVSPDGTRAYVTHLNDNVVSVIEKPVA